jgi:hypothetical protein
MTPPNKPVIGNLYDMEQQNEMHGGAHQQCAPTKDGEQAPQLGQGLMASGWGCAGLLLPSGNMLAT